MLDWAAKLHPAASYTLAFLRTMHSTGCTRRYSFSRNHYLLIGDARLPGGGGGGGSGTATSGGGGGG